MTEKFRVEKIVSIAKGAPMLDGSKAANAQVEVHVRHGDDNQLTTFQFPAVSPQSYILTQVRLALKRLKDNPVEHLADLEGKDFDL